MRIRRYGWLSCILFVALVLAGCSASPESTRAGRAIPWPTITLGATTPAPAEDGNASDAEATPTALEALATLPVKGRAPRTGYSRDEFGQRWADTDRNGCDTRNDILLRDLDDVVHREGTRDCVVASGVLSDPFTGRTIHFERGQDTSPLVQIDHVVALSDAWQKGAQQLTPERREQFANDPLNLLAVDGPTNQAKGAGDAATWLPPNRQFRCEYVSLQVSVKAKYDLWVTAAERDAIRGILDTCPGEPAPN